MGSSQIEIIARGIVEVAGRLLVCRNAAANYCYLPGGHVEFGESSDAALAREFLEETGERVTVGRLLSVHELQFQQGRRERHEISLLFHVELSNPATTVKSLEPKIAFGWIELNSLKSLDFRPRSTAEWLVGDRRQRWLWHDAR